MLIGCVWCGERNKWIKRTVLMRKGKKDKRVSGVGDKSRAKEIDVSISHFMLQIGNPTFKDCQGFRRKSVSG